MLKGAGRGRTIPDADHKLLLLDAFDVAAEQERAAEQELGRPWRQSFLWLS